MAKDESSAREIAEQRRSQIKAEETPNSKMTLEQLFSRVKTGDVKELSLILKSDVAGSLEAIKGMLSKIGNDEVKIKLVHSAVGGITESDVLLASTSSGGVIVGFNVRPDGGAARMAKEKGIEIKTYSIIYELIDDLKKALGGLLAPTVVEKAMGRAEVRNTFTVPKMGTIAGCFVTDGKIARNNMLRLVRDGKIVYEGKLGSLKRFKDDAKEVASGFECGIGIENFNDIKVGDVIEAFVKEEQVREL
jgi:translation initiation factor IF-2